MHADVRAVLAGYKRLVALDVALHRADARLQLAHLEAELISDLERSQGEQMETRTSRRSSATRRQGTTMCTPPISKTDRRQDYDLPPAEALVLRRELQVNCGP